MSRTATTIVSYSVYLFGMGLGMMFLPNRLLPLFGFELTTEIWIRMLGLFTFTTGIYYAWSARAEQTAFFRATVAGRLFFFLMTVVFVFLFNQSPMLAMIGSVDLLGGLWTWSTFKTRR